jgi:hypothetical protein
MSATSVLTPRLSTASSVSVTSPELDMSISPGSVTTASRPAQRTGKFSSADMQLRLSTVADQR